MNYAEKLKDPRWQKKRLEVFQRDDFTCRYCQDKNTTLHVHHMEYAGNPWDVDINKLITLCEDCHTLIESDDIPGVVIGCIKVRTKTGLFITVIIEDGERFALMYDISIDGVRAKFAMDAKTVHQLNNIINNKT